MKKLIAILMVLAIVAGFAFAADDPAITQGTVENHVITVNTHVAQINPVFNFKTANINGTNAATKFSDADYEAEDNTVLYGTDNQDISQAAISQEFVIQSVKKANYVGAFKLTVTATQFKHVVLENSEPIYITNSTITVTYPDTTATFESGRIKVESYNSVLKATFKGRQDGEPVNLATVGVEWSRDINALPGDYKADVKLAVEAL